LKFFMSFVCFRCCLVERKGYFCPHLKKQQKKTMKYSIENEESNGNCGCLECGKEMYGRKDKKFCSLGCKNTYNNRRLRSIRRHKDDVIQKLSKNYELLESMLSLGQSSVNLEELSRSGFDGKYVTSCRRGQNKHEECECFDIVYFRSESKIFNLHRKRLLP